MSNSNPKMTEQLHALADHLSARGQTVSCAESCTGGLLAAAFTSLPGSSRWFHQSFVTYSNEAKQSMLGVQAQTLQQHGAVSRETVAEMAQGAQTRAAAAYALSISGIAGPDGGSAEKPVGTVWFGLATPTQKQQQSMHFSGNREAVRAQAVAFALDWLVRHLED